VLIYGIIPYSRFRAAEKVSGWRKELFEMRLLKGAVLLVRSTRDNCCFWAAAVRSNIENDTTLDQLSSAPSRYVLLTLSEFFAFGEAGRDAIAISWSGVNDLISHH
jgi:hypothetical protein